MIYLTIVNVRLDGASSDVLAEAYIARDETATVWINTPPRSSRIVFDVEAPNEATAGERALELAREIAEATGGSVAEPTVSVTTDRDRLHEFANLVPTDP